MQTLLTCVFHLKSLVIVTPRYLMLSTFSRSVPSKVYEAWIFLIRFLVSCIILHLTGWNLIPHFLAQEPNRSISLWSFIVSSSSLISRFQSSAKSLISDSKKQELSGTKAYKETSEEEKSVVNGHCNHLALKFSVCVKERQDRLPTMYWLPKLHKKRIKHDLLQTQVLLLQLNFLNY